MAVSRVGGIWRSSGSRRPGVHRGRCGWTLVLSSAVLFTTSCGPRDASQDDCAQDLASTGSDVGAAIETDEVRALCTKVSVSCDRSPADAVVALAGLSRSEALAEDVDHAVLCGLTSGDHRVVAAALNVLRCRPSRTDEETRRILRSLLTSNERSVRMNAVICIGLVGLDRRDMQLVADILLDEGEYEYIRCNAALSLSHCQLQAVEAEVHAALLRAKDRAEGTLARYIAEALDRLGQNPEQRRHLLERWRAAMRES